MSIEDVQSGINFVKTKLRTRTASWTAAAAAPTLVATIIISAAYGATSLSVAIVPSTPSDKLAALLRTRRHAGSEM